MDRELAYLNTDILIRAILDNYHGIQRAFFNSVANCDAMNCSPKSSKHDLACICLKLSVKL